MSDRPGNEAVSRRCEAVSACVKRSLSLLKDAVGRRQCEWDVYKMVCNPYEMVYTAPPCVVDSSAGAPRRHPSSRAFYKLWELAKTDAGLGAVLADPEHKTFAYVAEAPGSFVEAAVTLRHDAGAGGGRDRHHVMSLGSVRHSVPHWKMQWSWMRAHQVFVSRGADGTGDETRLGNVESFVRDCGGDGSCDLVTGDGGFDFSADFNEQEGQMAALLAAQVLVAGRLLRHGGCAVIKVFDAFRPETRHMLADFMRMFRTHSVRKPATSRPGNSERYLVCSGYMGQCARARAALERVLASGGGAYPPPPAGECPDVVRYLEEINLEHSLAQVESILRIMDAMNRGDQTPREDLSETWIRAFLPAAAVAALAPDAE